jgi:hypothetical protein
MSLGNACHEAQKHAILLAVQLLDHTKHFRLYKKNVIWIM